MTGAQRRAGDIGMRESADRAGTSGDFVVAEAERFLDARQAIAAGCSRSVLDLRQPLAGVVGIYAARIARVGLQRQVAVGIVLVLRDACVRAGQRVEFVE